MRLEQAGEFMKCNSTALLEAVHNAAKTACEITKKNIQQLDNRFLYASSDNRFYPANDNLTGWEQGFTTGMYWLAYELTGEEIFRHAGEVHVESFYDRIRFKQGVDHHDMGFLYMPSCVAAYKLTGNETAKKAALMAADHLLTRYHEKGKFIQAWGEIHDPESCRMIVDCLMNIPLLYWASETTGDKHYQEIANNHYETTVRTMIREDRSVFHTYYFDFETGEPLRGKTAQGASDDSAWSRGQAWAIYGLLLGVKYQPAMSDLKLYQEVTDYFVQHLPEDLIPYWDLIYTDGDNEPRDSSAAAIALCGMMELQKFTDRFDDVSAAVLASLIKRYATPDDDRSNGLLLHATYSKPNEFGVDECNIWGDYFYMEALARILKPERALYW